jgi:hypothetical protein
MSDDDNVRNLAPQRLLNQASHSVKRLADAINRRSRELAILLGVSNTQGFKYLAQYHAIDEALSEDAATGLELLRQAVQILNRLPRPAVQGLATTLRQLDAAYAGHGPHPSFAIAHALRDAGADRQMLLIYFDLDSEYTDEHEQAEHLQLRFVLDDLLKLLDMDDDDLVGVIEIMEAWYT